MCDISENRRTEYRCLRDEIYNTDRTCILIMAFLIAATGGAGTAFIGDANWFVGWLLSPVWLLAFCYFSEKRFVIIRIAKYIREQIESQEPGLNWETHLCNLAKEGQMRPALPVLDPYLIEMFVCGLITGIIPWLGLYLKKWVLISVPFISSIVLFALFLCLAIRALMLYRPQGVFFKHVKFRS